MREPPGWRPRGGGEYTRAVGACVRALFSSSPLSSTSPRHESLLLPQHTKNGIAYATRRCRAPQTIARARDLMRIASTGARGDRNPRGEPPRFTTDSRLPTWLS
jgi:hypothetical protein